MKYKYETKYTSRSGVKKTRLAETKESAEKFKSNLLKSNKLHKSVGMAIPFKNARIVKIKKRSK